METNQALNSPLIEPDKDSLAELFARDPLKLTRADVSIICAELRKQRHRWEQSEAIKTPRAPRGSKKASPAKASLSPEMLDLLNSL